MYTCISVQDKHRVDCITVTVHYTLICSGKPVESMQGVYASVEYRMSGVAKCIPHDFICTLSVTLLLAM